jgi:UDP-N-acetyl-D-galactosamine dehydrogenase
VTRVAVLGLGYVGLPVAAAFARVFPTVGYDLSEARVAELRRGHDRTGELDAAELAGCGLQLSSRLEDLRGCDFFVVAVPTPIDGSNRPDLRALVAASRAVGEVVAPGAVVVFESTVYPGVTEEVCGPAIEEVSGLRCGADFKLGYSPERINPGDREHGFRSIVKVVAAQDAESLERVAACYEAVVDAGVFRAASIQVAEAAKALENTQRDLNIALMNEMALVFDRIGVDTREVLAAAGTKWNFLPFQPGLVGGHCIGVDPYYLATKAEEVGIHPQVILAGRRINSGMSAFVADRTLRELARAGCQLNRATVGVLGVTFKPGVPDIRNSRVPEVAASLADFGVRVLVHDPLADPAEVRDEYGLELVGPEGLREVDAVLLAVPHPGMAALAEELCREAGVRVLVDVPAAVERGSLPPEVSHWRL